MRSIAINFIILFLLHFTIISNAANPLNISGKVIDKKTGEELIGVTIIVEGTPFGAVTDFEGKYRISGLKSGTYTLVSTYVSYNKKVIKGIEVKDKEVISLNFSMEELTKDLQEYIVQADFKKETASALLIQQKNATSVSSGVSADLIRKTPDRTTADVIKRISGASIQDNKFAIVRGLSDRYNMGYLNGSQLPSTESDRKAFSLDIIPASVIDNMQIIKSATPDLPGDFAGGIIQINTKDIPNENTFSISVGSSFHTLTTFKAGLKSDGGNTDWLGYDNNSRQMPSGILSSEDNKQATYTQMGDQSKLFNNNFAPTTVNSVRPDFSLQISGSRKMKLFNNDFGVVGAVSYSNNYRYKPYSSIEPGAIGDIQSFDTSKSEGRFRKYDNYQNTVIIGGVLNVAYKINKHSKFSLKNILTLNSDDQTIRRSGITYSDGRSNPYGKQNTDDDYFFYYKWGRMISSQFSGEHLISSHNKIKIKYTLGFTNIHREIPDYKRLLYTSFKYNQDSVFSTPQATIAANGGGAYDPSQSGRFFSTLDEKMYSASYEISIPFKVSFLKKSEIKIGGMNIWRDRTFTGRNFVYAESDLWKDPNKDANKSLGPGQIFANKNLDSTGLYLTETTSGQDMYVASSKTDAVFAMFDLKPIDRFHLIGGIRMEKFNQKLSSESQNKPVKVDTTYLDWLPSVNAIYELTEKINIRAGFSKTVSRPEFREYAPLAFYEINLDAVIIGNPLLVRSQIYNYDLKFEYFPSAAQLFSVNPFYKSFINPVENEVRRGTGRRTFSYSNAQSATSYGVEFETRLNLGMFEIKQLQNFTFFANYSFIQSNVKLSPDTISGKSDIVTNRPMQGQSPYVFNAGIQYSNIKKHFDVTLNMNQVGRRIAYIGPNNADLIWEAPRTIFDASISKTFYKNLLVKLTLGDLLAQPLIFYQDLNKNGVFDEGKDVESFRYKYGSTIALSVGYTF